uniref:Uncharacterized protein n=1 Tax=Rhizophagus irregularis (strain DAOM 181602 / DAOM 197198 / MUCL 43194) TaxID=747089 RepID=U9TX62_RHIID
MTNITEEVERIELDLQDLTLGIPLREMKTNQKFKLMINQIMCDQNYKSFPGVLKVHVGILMLNNGSIPRGTATPRPVKVSVPTSLQMPMLVLKSGYLCTKKLSRHVIIIGTNQGSTGNSNRYTT